MVPAGGRKRGLNSEMHAAIWGAEFVRSPDNNDRAPVQPDDLIKWIGAGAICAPRACCAPPASTSAPALHAPSHRLHPLAARAAYWLSFPAKLEPGSELEYEAMTQSYVLFCRMGVAVKQPHNAAALGARLRQLRSPLTGACMRGWRCVCVHQAGRGQHGEARAGQSEPAACIPGPRSAPHAGTGTCAALPSADAMPM